MTETSLAPQTGQAPEIGALALESIELIRLGMPLVSPFRTSFGTATAKDALLVRVTAGSASGWGECVALALPVYSSEYTDGAHAIIRDHLAPMLLKAGPIRAEDVSRLSGHIVGHRMAKAALEAAVLDCQLQAAGISLAKYFRATKSAVDCGVSVGIMNGLDELQAAVAEFLEQGYRRIKLKIQPGWDVEPVRAIRQLVGPGFPLQVDANAAYRPADADQLARLDPFELLLIEQPFPEEMILAHARLAERIQTPVCLDESILSAVVAEEALDMGACSIINIKAGRVGGYLEAVRIHDLCLGRGNAVWCGGMLETGIGRAFNVALAAMPGFTLPGDTSATDRYYREDITESFVLEDGRLTVPTGAGIGVKVDIESVERFSTAREVLRA